jgi:hypothetical protein
MKTLSFLVILLGLSVTSAYAAEEGPFTLEMGSWVCQTPEDYDNAVAAQKEGSKSAFKLAKELFEQNLCIYMDDDNLEDMLAPYVKIIETQGDKTKVSFFIEFYKRIAMLHRQIKHVKFIGWTDTKNIKKHRMAS